MEKNGCAKVNDLAPLSKPLCTAHLGPQVMASETLVPYEAAVDWMRKRAEALVEREADEALWFLEHPPLISLGVRAPRQDALDERFPIYRTNRGGLATYHGPGQLVAYVLFDLRRRGRDVRAFVFNLEEVVRLSLASLGLETFRRAGRVGLWTGDPLSPSGESKVAAIGVRLSRWVSYHGLSINRCPNLDHYRSLVPCGLDAHGVTSLEAMGLSVSRNALTCAVTRAFAEVFEMGASEA